MDSRPASGSYKSLFCREGYFPSCLKLARVTPVHKKGSKQDLNNFRPISILSTISCILEGAVLTRLATYHEENNLLDQAQFGLRKKKGCIPAIINFV